MIENTHDNLVYIRLLNQWYYIIQAKLIERNCKLNIDSLDLFYFCFNLNVIWLNLF